MTLSEKRRSLDMSLGECARNSGLTVPELSAIEFGRKTPSAETCDKIGAALGLTREEVVASLPDVKEVQKRYEGLSDACAITAPQIHRPRERQSGAV